MLKAGIHVSRWLNKMYESLSLLSMSSTSSLVEEMASRMTPCTSLLPPRLPVLPTSPRHNRARTRADSGEPGLFTWAGERWYSDTETEAAWDIQMCKQTLTYLLHEAGHGGRCFFGAGGGQSSHTASDGVIRLSVDDCSVRLGAVERICERLQQLTEERRGEERREEERRGRGEERRGGEEERGGEERRGRGEENNWFGKYSEVQMTSQLLNWRNLPLRVNSYSAAHPFLNFTHLSFRMQFYSCLVL